MPLSDYLSPAVQGARAARQDIDARNASQLQQAQGVLSLQGLLRQQQEAAAVKDALARGDMDALARLPGGVAVAGQLAQLAEHQTKLAQAKRTEAFRARLPEFMTPAQPEYAAPADELGGGPGQPAQPAKMDLQGLLRASVAAGVQDPITYAKEQLAEQKPIFAPRNSPGYFQNGQWTSTPVNETPKPMVEHNMPVGDGTKVQPHISLDGGKTWTPVEGSVASPKFAKQVAPTFISGDHSAYSNVQPDGKGGWLGLSKRSGRMEQIPTGDGIVAAEKPLTAIGKLNSDLKAGRISPEEHKAAMAKATGDGGVALSADAIEQGADRYLLDGTLPQNLGRGTQGATNTARMLNRAAEKAKESGDSGEETRIRQIAGKAGQMALGQLTKQKNLILAFENTAGRNADLALQQSEITDRPTEKPAIDRWLQAGKKQLQGDVAVAKLDLAVKSFANEYARVVTSVTGGGVTSDNARAEIQGMINSAQTKEQLREVIALAKQEMRNRRLGYEQQESEIKNGFKRPKAGAVDANSFFR